MWDDLQRFFHALLRGSEFGLVAVVGSLMGNLIDKVRKNQNWHWRESAALCCMAYIVGQVAYDVEYIRHMLEDRWGFILAVGVISRPLFEMGAETAIRYADRGFKRLVHGQTPKDKR